MTPEQWLKTPSKQRLLLAKVNYLANGLKTAYLATGAYISEPSDIPANIPFDDLIMQSPRFSREIGIFTGKSSASKSDLVVYAHELLTPIFEGNVYKQEVEYFIGDELWPFSDFIKVGSQLASSITAKKDDLIINMDDPSIKLDKIIDTGLFTQGENIDKPMPLCLGDVFNIEPVLEAASTHKYRVNFTAVQDIQAVRDNGIEVSYNKNNSEGTFTLNQPPVGRITCDVLGTKTSAWLRYPKEIINWLLSTFVGEVNIDDLSVLPNYTVGIFQREPDTVRSIVDFICSSINGYHYYTRLGVFTANVMPEITGNHTAQLTLDDINAGGVSIRKTTEPVSQVFINYRQNFTPQSDGLAGAVSSSNRDLFSTEFQTVEVKNELPDYPDAEPITIDTCLVNSSEAQLLAATKAAIASIRRTIYEVDALAVPFLFELGQEIELTYWDYGLRQGETGIIISLNDSPLEGEVTVELWR